MAYTAHVRITCSGQIGVAGSGFEQFQYGLSYAAASGLTETQMNNMAVQLVTLHTSVDARIWAGAVLKSIKFATIDTTGHYTVEPYIVAENVGGASASGDALHPPQVSWCTTLEDRPAPGSAITSSRRKRGRMYLPCPVLIVGPTTGEVDPTDAAACAAAVAACIEGLNTDGGGNVVVASKIDGNHIVNHVRVGCALDTIRSRRKSLVEHYAGVTIL